MENCRCQEDQNLQEKRQNVMNSFWYNNLHILEPMLFWLPSKKHRRGLHHKKTSLQEDLALTLTPQDVRKVKKQDKRCHWATYGIGMDPQITHCIDHHLGISPSVEKVPVDQVPKNMMIQF